MSEETNIEDASLDLATLLTQTLRTEGKIKDTPLVERKSAQFVENTETEVHCYRLPKQH